MRMYAISNNGFLPPDFYTLFEEDRKTKDSMLLPEYFLCPCVEHKNPPQTFLSSSQFITDYYYNYTTGLKIEENKEKAKKQIIALEYIGNHEDFGNILFGDGHVKGYSGPEWYRKAGYLGLTE